MKNSSLWIILHRMRMPFIVIIVTYTIAIIGMLVIAGKDNLGNVYHMSIFDAFYFVTYTATTIGFGETPYEFTYSQRLWVTFSIYLTVLGWFYGIGTLVSLLQDKLLLNELKRAKFKRDINHIRGKFIIVLGYNNVTSSIIKKALKSGIRTVVIEEDEKRVNNLILESFTPSVPILQADVHNKYALIDAGLEKINCKAIVSLFESEKLNLKIAITAKLLNKNIILAIKSSSSHQSQNLKDINTQIIANPFSIISSELSLAFSSPNILKLEKWVYKIDDLNTSISKLPRGKYIICGYGRMGKYIYEKFDNLDLDLVFIDIRKKNNIPKNLKIVYGDADEKLILEEAGIYESCVIIAATNDDIVNLSVLSTAKKLNKNIITIARENEFDDITIFKNAKIDHIYMPEKILIHKITNALINPLSDIFVHELLLKDEMWAAKLLASLIKDINENPILFELVINENEASEIKKSLKHKELITLKLFHTSLHNRELTNNVVPLLLLRDEKRILLPSWDEIIKLDDKILFACDNHAKEDIQFICLNAYEFSYAHKAKEKSTILKRFL